MVDPLGLASFSINAYWYLGGGLTIGKDPNGSWWITGRFGAGIGGGAGYDPDDNSPGYKKCSKTTSENGGVGLFIEGDIGVVASVGAEARGGFGPGHSEELNSNGGYSPNLYGYVDNTSSWIKPKLSGMFAGGVEFLGYLSDADREEIDCGCP